MIVNWTENSIEHLVGIYDYISQRSPTYARRTVDRLTRRSEQLADFPMSGRMVPEYNMRNIREVIEGSYRIIYHLRPQQIDVIAVMHSAQELPEID